MAEDNIFNIFNNMKAAYHCHTVFEKFFYFDPFLFAYTYTLFFVSNRRQQI